MKFTDICAPDCNLCLAEYERESGRIRTMTDPLVTFPASLTVYTSAGTFTVENVREDSIRLDGTTLTAESDDKNKTHLFTFVNVGGYSTVLT